METSHPAADQVEEDFNFDAPQFFDFEAGEDESPENEDNYFSAYNLNLGRLFPPHLRPLPHPFPPDNVPRVPLWSLPPRSCRCIITPVARPLCRSPQLCDDLQCLTVASRSAWALWPA